jgi:hypothetical protein
MELFNKALFLSQQKMFALTHRRVYTLVVNLFQILNQFVLLFRQNVIEKSSMIWRVLPLVKINTRISETPGISLKSIFFDRNEFYETIFSIFSENKNIGNGKDICFPVILRLTKFFNIFKFPIISTQNMKIN